MSIKKAELLLANRDFAGARKVLRSLLIKNKINNNAMYLLSIAEAELGNADEALDILSRIVAIDPHHAAAHYTKANLLVSLKRHLDALTHHDRAVELFASNPWSFINRGISRAALKNFSGAIDDFDRAISLDPTLSDAVGNKGNALLEMGLFEQSLQFFDKAIELDPFNVDTLSGKSACLSKLKRSEEALAFSARATKLKPDYVEAWCNHGNALSDLRRHEEALASYDRAIALKPDYAEAWSNRGNSLIDLRRDAEALASYDRAIELKPDYAEAFWNKSLVLLRCGLFEEGWKLYEWRWQLDSFITSLRHFIQPLWHGELPIAGKTILLHAEQGFGDSIQFFRYVELVASHGAKVVVEVQKPLISIFKETLGKTITVVSKGDDLPKFNYHCPLLSLPLAFKTGLNSIPADVPYLRPDNSKVEGWSKKLGPKKQVRIGIVWSGNREHKNDKNRSVCASQISALLSNDFEWFSLQKDYRDGDLQTLQRSRIHDYSNDLLDFSDTAALLSQLDLVISVDTSVAHLAGAMGKPTWVMLPYTPDFRWLWDREDSPWYPSMRLFRQATAGDWSPVIDDVSSALRARYNGIW